MGTFSVTSVVAQGMLNGTGLAESIGASPKIVIYGGTPPTNADTALSSNTVLATLTCAVTPISGFSDTGTAARATYAAIASASAVATGTGTFFRQLDSAGTTAKFQGSVGTTATDLILNTAAITTGSTVSITSATVDLPKGP
jgi:hypothetical protein